MLSFCPQYRKKDYFLHVDLLVFAVPVHQVITRNLNKIIDINYYPVEEVSAVIGTAFTSIC